MRLPRSYLVEIACQVLALEKKPHAAITLVFVNDVAMRAYHKIYFHKTTTTDVISFPFGDDMDQEFHLGDLVISAERARGVCQNYGHSLRAELALYVIHGLLHLLGYDDINVKDRVVMMARQKELVEKLVLQSTGALRRSRNARFRAPPAQIRM